MVFKLFAIAQLQLIYFDTLGRIGDLWGIYGLLGAHKGLLLCHFSTALCLLSFLISYTGFCTLASFELLSILALAIGLLGF